MGHPSSGPVSPSHYAFGRYVPEARWGSYWHQISEILALQPGRALEIGVGPGIVSTVLRHLGVDCRTVDVDADLRPDCVASALELPFPAASFDLVACFQVLEHLPYDGFGPALGEIRRVCSGHAVLSLPDASHSMQAMVRLPVIGARRVAISAPRVYRRGLDLRGEHQWEIGRRGYALERIRSQIEQAGFHIVRTYRGWANPFHRFFVLQRAP
jgi:SAM-dependent methyltransferase